MSQERPIGKPLPSGRGAVTDDDLSAPAHLICVRCPCGKRLGECQAWVRNGEHVCPSAPQWEPSR